MKVAELMSRYVDFAEGDDTVASVAVAMGDLEVGALPVGSADRIEGVITDRDILYRVVALGLDPTRITAREAMSSPVIACRPDDAIEVAMDMMGAHHVRRLAVTDPDGKLAGWLTLSDISRRLLVDTNAVQAGLRELSGGTAG